PAFAFAVFASGGLAGEFRVGVGGRFSLRPSGQEKLFQINFDVRNAAHAKSTPHHAGPKINHRMDWCDLESKRQLRQSPSLWCGEKSIARMKHVRHYPPMPASVARVERIEEAVELLRDEAGIWLRKL